MDGTSAVATSAGSEADYRNLPRCVVRRAEDLLDLATVRLLTLCLGTTVVLQILALVIAVLAPPALYYAPEAGR